MPDRYTLYALVLYYIASAAVSSLPVPQDHGSPLYEWLYKFSNALMANVTALRGKALYEPKMQTVAAETTTASVSVATTPTMGDKP